MLLEGARCRSKEGDNIKGAVVKQRWMREITITAVDAIMASSWWETVVCPVLFFMSNYPICGPWATSWHIPPSFVTGPAPLEVT